MPDGVGDGFLRATHESVGLIRGDPHAGRDVHMNGRGWHALRQRLQCTLQIAAFSLSQSGDDITHLGEEGASQAFRLHHMIVRPAGLGKVACDLELQPKRSQLVAPGIVQFARDTQALRVAHGIADDGLCGSELPIRLGERSRRFPFPSQRLRREKEQ